MNLTFFFRQIDNPVVAYFDDDTFFEAFRNIRNGDLANKTKIVKVDRKDLWAFKLMPKVTRIFSDPMYPKFQPNTVVPEYSCSMHAKYELMIKAINDNYFTTDDFAWIDIGLFRHQDPSRTAPFRIGLPPKFNHSHIGSITRKVL